MFDIFSSREIVGGIYLGIIICYICLNKSTRDSAIAVVKAAMAPKIRMPFLCIVVYTEILILIFTGLSFWNYVFIKDIIMWVLFVGVPTSFQSISKGTEPEYFPNIILKNLKLTVLVEFFISTFTFNIIIEFILQAVIAYLVLLGVFADRDENHAQVKRFVDCLLTAIGIIIFCFTLKAAWREFDTIDAVGTVVSFWIPIVFSILYMPVSYVLALYAKYELVFMRIKMWGSADQKINRKRKLAVIKACGFSLNRTHECLIRCIPQLYTTMPVQDFDILIEEFKKSFEKK